MIFSLYLLPVSILLIILNWHCCIFKEIIAITHIVFTMIGFISGWFINVKLDDAADENMIITDIGQKEYDYIPTVATLLSFVCIDYKDVNSVVFHFVLLLVLLILFIQTKYFYASPVLVMFGFSIYEITGKHEDTQKSILAISRDTLKKDSPIYLTKITNNLYYCKNT